MSQLSAVYDKFVASYDNFCNGKDRDSFIIFLSVLSEADAEFVIWSIPNANESNKKSIRTSYKKHALIHRARVGELSWHSEISPNLKDLFVEPERPFSSKENFIKLAEYVMAREAAISEDPGYAWDKFKKIPMVSESVKPPPSTSDTATASAKAKGKRKAETSTTEDPKVISVPDDGDGDKKETPLSPDSPSVADIVLSPDMSDDNIADFVNQELAKGPSYLDIDEEVSFPDNFSEIYKTMIISMKNSYRSVPRTAENEAMMTKFLNSFGLTYDSLSRKMLTEEHVKTLRKFIRDQMDEEKLAQQEEGEAPGSSDPDSQPKVSEKGKSVLSQVNKMLGKKSDKTIRLINYAIPPKLRNLFNMEEPARVDFVTHRLIVKPTELNSEGLYKFMRVNQFEVTDIKDIVFSTVLIGLLDAGVIEPTETTVYAEVEGDQKPAHLTDDRMMTHVPLARTMLVIAIHAYSQGHLRDEIPWYDSFCKVKGYFITSKRFTTLVQMITNSPHFHMVSKMITLNEVLKQNKVLKYRLVRLSSPGLVKTALDIMPYKEVTRSFDPIKLAEYRRFEEGGLLTQIAAGPLSVFCVGAIDPYSASEWPENATISDLTAIPEGPYDTRTLIRAKIILDLAGVEYGKWYQADRASKSMTHSDLNFKVMVKAILAKLKDDANKIDFENFTLSSDNDRTAEDLDAPLSRVLTGWVNT